MESGDELPTVGGVPSHYGIYCESVGHWDREARPDGQ